MGCGRRIHIENLAAGRAPAVVAPAIPRGNPDGVVAGLGPQAVTLLSEMREDSTAEPPFLFPGDAPGKPLQEIKRFWRSTMTEAGISHYRRHDNRHTFASHLVSSGLSLEIIGRLLGHTNPATTKRYAHLSDDPLRAAASRFGSKIEGLRSGKEAEIVPMRPKA